ncbi:MAG: hypothetical protein R2880_03410 [Deinococcales bacterium]
MSKSFLRLALVMVGCLGLAQAQLSYRGEIAISAGWGLSYVKVPQFDLDDAGQPTQMGESWLGFDQFSLGLDGHLELEYQADERLEGLSGHVVLDPSSSFDGGNEPSLDAGLTEAYLLYRRGSVDVSGGLERLPLETARLNVPFSIAVKDPTRLSLDPKGFFQGIWGARLSWFSDSVRLRAAGFYKDESFGAALSARAFFGDFELEAHAVYDKNLNFGLGGSGLLGDIVIYGEGWFLLNRSVTIDEIESQRNEILASLGATGYLGDGIWTLEGAYLPSLISSDAHPQLAGQLSFPYGESGNWSLDLRALFVSEGAAGGFALSYTEALADRNVTLSLSSQLSDRALALGLGAKVTGFF